MPSTLPISISLGALPPNVRWTPQQLGDALVARMFLVTNGTFALFASGTTEPASNVGPWFNGTSWLYWSNVTGDYQPIVLAPESLGYTIGANPPNPLTYAVWIETNVAGSPLAVKIYYSGAWVDVYAAQLVLKAPLASPTFTGTPAAPTAAPGTNNTQIASTAFVTAAVAAIPPVSAFETYPAQGVRNTQTVPISGAAVFTKIAFNAAPINPTPAPFDTANNRYIAQATGNHEVSFACQCDNAGGVASAMEVNAALYKNGVFVGNLMADLDSTPSPNGSRWSPGFSGLVSLVITDYLEIFMSAADGVNAANLTVSAQLSVHRVSA